MRHLFVMSEMIYHMQASKNCFFKIYHHQKINPPKKSVIIEVDFQTN